MLFSKIREFPVLVDQPPGSVWYWRRALQYREAGLFRKLAEMYSDAASSTQRGLHQPSEWRQFVSCLRVRQFKPTVAKIECASAGLDVFSPPGFEAECYIAYASTSCQDTSSAQHTFIDRSHMFGTYGIDTRLATPVEETSQI